jgi:hypothetical protein
LTPIQPGVNRSSRPTGQKSITKIPPKLRELERRLSFSPTKNFHQQYLFTPDPAQAALSPGLASKIDGLLARVSLILNLWPNGPNSLRIILLSNGEEVRQRWLALQPFLRDRPIFGYGSLSAFYEPLSRTIFLSLADLHAGVLAHEMAHFILNESFSRRPPAPLQEQWYFRHGAVADIPAASKLTGDGLTAWSWSCRLCTEECHVLRDSCIRYGAGGLVLLVIYILLAMAQKGDTYYEQLEMEQPRVREYASLVSKKGEAENLGAPVTVDFMMVAPPKL